MSFGKWLAAVGALVVIVGAVEQYNPRYAYGLAIVTLMAIAFHNRRILDELRREIISPLPAHEGT